MHAIFLAFGLSICLCKGQDHGISGQLASITDHGTTTGDHTTMTGERLIQGDHTTMTGERLIQHCSSKETTPP